MSTSSDANDKSADPQITAFWEGQLQGLDFSVLPDPPSEAAAPTEAAPAAPQNQNTALARPANIVLLAMLASLYKQVRDDPSIYEEALIVVRRPGGKYRIIFPSSYSKESLDGLAQAALYFAQLLAGE